MKFLNFEPQAIDKSIIVKKIIINKKERKRKRKERKKERKENDSSNRLVFNRKKGNSLNYLCLSKSIK